MKSSQDLQAEYNFYKEHVPVSSLKKLDTISMKLSSERLKNILVNRRIVLSDILFSQEKTTYLKKDSKILPKDPVKFVCMPDIWNAPYPTLFQKVSYIINLFFSKSNQYIAGLMDIIDTQEYYYSIFSVIPAIFGFFSSKEQCFIAKNFYMQFFESFNIDFSDDVDYFDDYNNINYTVNNITIIKEAKAIDMNKNHGLLPLNKLKVVLKPFFGSAAMFRFFEFIFKSFLFSKFISSSLRRNLNNNNNKNICNNNNNDNDSINRNNKRETAFFESLASDLTNLICKAVPLIPKTHIEILKAVRENYSKKDMISFLFFHLKCQALLWLESYNKVQSQDQAHQSQADLLKIFDVIENKNEKDHKSEKQLEKINNIINSINDVIALNKKTLFELPELYKPFKSVFYQTYLTLQDILVLSEVLSLRVPIAPIEGVQLKTGQPLFDPISVKISLSDIFSKQNGCNVTKGEAAEDFTPIIFNQNFAKPIFCKGVKENDLCENQKKEKIWIRLLKESNDEFMDPLDYLRLKTSKNALKNIGISPFFSNISEEFVMEKYIDRMKTSSANFERLINYQLKLKELESWHSVCMDHEQIVFSGFSMRLAKSQLNCTNIKTAFENASKYTFSNTNKETQFLIILEHFLPSYLKESEFPKLNLVMQKKWKSFLSKNSKNYTNLGNEFKLKPSYKFFLYAISKIADTTDFGLSTMYQTLLDVVSNLRLIEVTEEKIEEKRIRNNSKISFDDSLLNKSSSESYDHSDSSSDDSLPYDHSSLKSSSSDDSIDHVHHSNSTSDEIKSELKLDIALSLSRCPNLLWDFFILNIFVFGNAYFRNICTLKEHSTFRMLNSVMLSMITQNSDLLLFFVEMRTKVIGKIIDEDQDSGGVEFSYFS